MKISYLADHPEFIPILAPGIAAHWGSVIPGETVVKRITKLEAHLNKGTLPIAWVAHSQGEVFGTAALRANDLEGREDLSPWLGGVFVRPEFRGRGVATALCQTVETNAWALGIARLYLFTIDRQSLYARLGWKESDAATWRGYKSNIMVKHRMTPNQSSEPTFSSVTPPAGQESRPR